MTDYISAGVDISKGNRFAALIKDLLRQNTNGRVLNGIGGFSALYELPPGYYKNPVIASSTDGVGTKVKLALETGKMYNVGIDLVAMCVNDIICCGADPLFFLDYYATDKLTEELDREGDFIRGVIDGCNQANMSLVGGETAEMPGMYNNEFDVAGFCVGIVDKDKIISPQTKCIVPHDVIIGLPSNGPHANGYSLIRKIINDNDIGDVKFLDAIMEPTKIYVDTVRLVKSKFDIKGIAHITGGGMIENIPRVLPDNMMAKIYRPSWSLPEIFEQIQSLGNITDWEMHRVFNCGIGMALVVSSEDAAGVVARINENANIHLLCPEKKARIIGTVHAAETDKKITFIT